MNAEVCLLEMDSESLIGREQGRWRSALAAGAQCLRLSLALKSHTHTHNTVDKTTSALVVPHMHICRMCAHVCV